MSDRTSPEIFWMIYTELAKNPTDEHKAIAAKLWKLSQNFDFCDEEVGCFEAMVALGIAEKVGDEMRFGLEGSRK